MRTLLITLAVLVTLVVGAALLLPLVLDKERLLAVASDRLQQETGAKLAVEGDIDLSFYPILGIALSQASITMPEKTEPDLVIGALQIGVQVMPLLGGEVAIDSISLADLDVRIESGPDEERVDTSAMSDAALDDWYAKRREERSAAGRAAGAEAALAVPLALNVARLRVNDARLEMIDAQGASSVVVINALDARELNIDGRPIPLAIELGLPGEQPLEIRLAGEVRVELESKVAHLDDMKVDLRGATAERVELALSGPVEIARQVADLKLTLATGPTQGEGSLRYAAHESPQIDADLHLNLLDPALLLLAGPEAAETQAPVDDSSLPLDTLRAIDTRASLRIDAARFGAHTVNDLVATLRAVEGVVTLGTLTGELHGGKLDASATFDGRHNTARLDTRGGLAGLGIAQALRAVESTVPLSGNASLNWELRSSGRSVDDLTLNLAGPLKLDTQDITLAGTNVEKMLCATVALANQKKLTEPFGTDTRFETLSAQVQLADGNAVLDPLQARLPNLGLRGKGRFDITTGDLQARFNAKLDPGIEELDPACNISRRLAAVEFPVNCRGNTATDPAKWCSVDAEQILKDLAVNEGRKKLEKEAGKFLNKLLEKQNRKKAEKEAAAEAQ